MLARVVAARALPILSGLPFLQHPLDLLRHLGCVLDVEGMTLPGPDLLEGGALSDPPTHLPFLAGRRRKHLMLASESNRHLLIV